MSDYTSEEIQEVYRKRREYEQKPRKEVYPYPQDAKGQVLLNVTQYEASDDGEDYEWVVFEFDKGYLVHETITEMYEQGSFDYIYEITPCMPDELKEIFYNQPNQ